MIVCSEDPVQRTALSFGSSGGMTWPAWAGRLQRPGLTWGSTLSTAPSMWHTHTPTAIWRYKTNTLQFCYVDMSVLKVPLIDSEIPEDKILLRDILYNFIHEQHPYQAIDDMTSQNMNCSSFF